MNVEQELRDYVKEHLGEDNINIGLYTSVVDGYSRLHEFTVSFGDGYSKIQESIEKKKWTPNSEKKLVSNIKAGIDKVVAKREREELEKSIMKRVAGIFKSHGFNAEATYNGVAVFCEQKKYVLSSGAQVIFKISTNKDNSKLVIQHRDSNQHSGPSVSPNDCYYLDLSDPGSLDDGLISFVKKISVDEVDRRLVVKKRGVAQLEKWKAGLDDEDICESVKQIMPGFANG